MNKKKLYRRLYFRAVDNELPERAKRYQQKYADEVRREELGMLEWFLMGTVILTIAQPFIQYWLWSKGWM